MERTIAFIAVFFFFASQVISQPLTAISGTIKDQTTKEPIPYANIGIEGTYTGAASDINGNFEFKVPETNTGTFVLASAVGYQGVRIAISDLVNGRLQLEMIPTAYDIGVVNINAQSLVLFRILKNAIGAIGENYLKGPFSTKTYYKSEATVYNEPSRVTEAIVEISDLKGYRRESALEVQKHLNYKFLGLRRNFKVGNLSDGMNQLDDLLGLDIVRMRGNVLDESFLAGYDLSLDQVGQFEGDSVWVINYRLKTPDLARTGDYYVKAYEGKIFIAKSNYAVLKNETWVKADDFSTLGRSFANTSVQKWNPVSIGYDFCTTYRKGKDGYRLVYLKCNRRNVWKDKTNGDLKTESFTNYLVPTEVNTINPNILSTRTYFDDAQYDAAIWNGFSLIVD